jgi:F-type H+-transporting ATPase subunit delta
MISSAVFYRYARSLAEVALEEKQEETVTADLTSYREIFKSVPEMLSALDTPALPRETKSNLLLALLGKYPVSRISENFLHVLVDHHRIRYFEEIYLAYVRSVNERRGVVAARVTTANDLSKEQLSQLRASLADAIGKTVTLDVRTDAGLLGGLIVQVGSTVYDGSIRSQLDDMKRRLAEA